jgi:hypothetical protein
LRTGLRRRFRKALAFSLGIATFKFILDWLGYGDQYRSTGQIRPLSEIWWHLPVLASILLALLLLWPWRMRILNGD